MSAQPPTLREIAAAVCDGLEPELDASRIADFLASVDWGRVTPRSQVASLLGQLEAWTEAYREAELSEGQYVDRLKSVVQAQHNTRRDLASGSSRRHP